MSDADAAALSYCLYYVVRLDGIITVVDAKHIVQHLDEDRPNDVSAAVGA